MATKIQLRRDTSSNWAILNVTLSSGEIGFETDTNKFKIGNGSTVWADLPYFSEAQDLSAYATISSLNYGIVSASAAAVSYLVDSAPGALDTLNELAAALGDDANYASTVTSALGNKLDISSASTTYLTQASASTNYQEKVENVDNTEIGYLNGVSSAIQTQLDSKYTTQGAWTSYTPTMPSGWSYDAIGRYVKIGRTVHFSLTSEITTVSGTPVLSLTLPVTASPLHLQKVFGTYGAYLNNNYGIVSGGILGGNTVSFQDYQGTNLTSSSPNWTSGGSIVISGTYESAS